MASNPDLYSIDNAGPYAVIARTYCLRILVQENFNSTNPPTADLQQFGVISGAQPGGVPVASSVAGAIPKGTAAIFTKGSMYSPGEVAGFINTAAGSIQVAQFESSQV